MKEIWKDIEGYEGKYQVSNFGNVKRISVPKKGRGVKGYIRGGLLKPDKDKAGYLRTTLCMNGKHKHFLIHRLVGKAFICNPNNFPEINHKDENKSNNNVDNLEWCTGIYNVNYGTGKIRAVLNKDCKKAVEKINYKKIGEKRQKPVMQLSADTSPIKIWKGIKEAAEALGIWQGSISNCCTGRTHTAGGYKWEYFRS